MAGRYVFHDLRHTAASGMLAAGVPVSEVAELLGHASTSVTTAIYAHVIRRSGRSAVEQLEAFYDGEAGDGRGSVAAEGPAGVDADADSVATPSPPVR